MSSSSVCQGLQSCLEPRVIEPRVLRLKLAPPGSNNSRSKASSSSSEQENSNHECDKKDTKANMEGHGWSFLQSLSNTSQNEDEKVYVHPTIKRSSSVLSAKSLEMCTESLGSETGSNGSESNDEVSIFESSTRHNNNNTTNWVSKRVNKACNFPPPLTSMTDFGGVHVRSHREGGRLILEAIASPSPRPYFHAERGDGRLKLSLFEGHFASDDDEEGIGEEWSNEEEGEISEMKQESCGEEKEEESGVEEELEECVDNVEDEMGVTKFARPSRCKESGNRDIFGDGYFELPSLSLCL
ncbi:The fantastic four family [Sesbania bispinosa]|nr:The fantastic four family [Sesbania bispinosa]